MVGTRHLGRGPSFSGGQVIYVDGGLSLPSY